MRKTNWRVKFFRNEWKCPIRKSLLKRRINAWLRFKNFSKRTKKKKKLSKRQISKRKRKTIHTSVRMSEIFRVTCVTFRFDIVNGTRSHELWTLFRGILCFFPRLYATWLNTSYLSRKQQRRKKSALLGNEWTKRLIIFSRFHFHRLLAECYEVTSAYEWPYSSACNFFSEASNARYAIENRNKFREKIRSIFLEPVSSNDKRDNINFYRLDWFIDRALSITI